MWPASMHGLTSDVLVASGHAGVAQNAGHGVSNTVVLWTGAAMHYWTARTRLQTTSQRVTVHDEDGRLWDGRKALARRQLLTDEERQALLGIPPDTGSLARLFILSQPDRSLVAERRGDANRLGYAVQLALLCHPGTALAYLDQPADALVTWMASQIEILALAFAEYARRPQTMTDHARQLVATLRWPMAWEGHAHAGSASW